MGFQFNHVGGGTKTRRPITLHMKYNSACVQPVCYLLTEEFGEQEVSLEEVQVRLQPRAGGFGIRAKTAKSSAVSLCRHDCYATQCRHTCVVREGD